MNLTLSWRQATVAALLFNAAVTASYETRQDAEVSEDPKRSLDSSSIKARNLDIRNFVQRMDVASVLSALGADSGKAQGSSGAHGDNSLTHRLTLFRRCNPGGCPVSC